MNGVLTEPLSPGEAKRLAQAAIANGVVFPGPHALDQMEERNVAMQDVMNILRAGVYDPAEFENGSWRYRVRTARMAVVVAFHSDVDPIELWIVTAWRYQK